MVDVQYFIHNDHNSDKDCNENCSERRYGMTMSAQKNFTFQQLFTAIYLYYICTYFILLELKNVSRRKNRELLCQVIHQYIRTEVMEDSLACLGLISLYLKLGRIN